MTGVTIVLGNHRSPHSTYMQAAGEAQRIKTAELRKAMRASASLQGLLLKYVQAFMVPAAGGLITRSLYALLVHPIDNPTSGAQSTG
jgi:hypothetical protein